MIQNVINNVFIIRNGIEDILDYLIFEDNLIKFIVLDINDLKIPEIEKIDKIKEHNLLIIKYENYNDGNIKVLQKFFVENFKFSSPYKLFIIENNLENNIERKIFIDESYLYLKPQNCNLDFYRSNFRFFIRAIFDRLHYIGRLNEYIVDSFQTIINAQIIEEQKNEIEKLNEELKKLSKTDYLTNVLNRRAFFEVLEAEKKRTIRDHWRLNEADLGYLLKDKKTFSKAKGSFFEHYGNFSIIIIDIDHFKKINDKYGHLKGDEVLKKLGEILNRKDIFRENDVVARYGGEEFIVILPETNTYHAKIPAERLRKYIKTIKFETGDGGYFNITLSMGISEFRITDVSNEDIINRADQALYYSKENGRDQVTVYEEIMDD